MIISKRCFEHELSNRWVIKKTCYFLASDVYLSNEQLVMLDEAKKTGIRCGHWFS